MTTSGFADAQTETRMIRQGEIQDYVRMGYSYSGHCGALSHQYGAAPSYGTAHGVQHPIPDAGCTAKHLRTLDHPGSSDLHPHGGGSSPAEKHQAKRADALRIINQPKRYISREALDGQIISWDSVKSWYKGENWMVERIEDLGI